MNCAFLADLYNFCNYYFPFISMAVILNFSKSVFCVSMFLHSMCHKSHQVSYNSDEVKK